MPVCIVTAELQYCNKIETVPECIHKENNGRRHVTCMLGFVKLEKRTKAADIVLGNDMGD